MWPTVYLRATSLCWKKIMASGLETGTDLAGDYLSLVGLSGGDSSAQALPSILFLASAYSASRWARDLICGVGLFWLRGDPSEPLLTGRFRMRI